MEIIVTYQGPLCTNRSCEKSCARLCFNLPVAVPPMGNIWTVTGSVGLGAIAVTQAVARPSLSDTVRDVELNPTITRGDKIKEERFKKSRGNLY